MRARGKVPRHREVLVTENCPIIIALLITVERAIISANVQSPTVETTKIADNLGRGKFRENATYDGRVDASFIDDKSILNLHNHSPVAGGGRIFDNFCIGRGKLVNVRRRNR